MSMGDRVRVAVAGANGKTTTSAMVATALLGAGLDPSYAIGSPLVATGVSSAIGAGRAFVVEADESDSSFLTYHPHIAVVTNVQPDHLDFYGDFAHVEEAYAAGTRVLTYGESYDADVRIEDVILTGAGGAARVVAGDQGVDLRIAAPGRHNLANAVAALTVGWFGLGADPAALAKALESFAGTRRRFEVKGTVRGITVVDDYAHNAPKVAALVSAARAQSGDLVLTVGAGDVTRLAPALLAALAMEGDPS